jgi:hypothetical protein
MKKTACISIWAVLFLWAFPLFSEILPAGANGVVVTEPEGRATEQKKPKPAKKASPSKNTAPAAKKEVQREPDSLPPMNLSLQQGILLLGQRYFSRATPLLERAVLEEPDNPVAWHALGRAYHERGLFSRAQEAYKKALEAEPEYPPLSRILAYPPGDGRKPLWDPKRPERIEALSAATGGFSILPPDKAPNQEAPDSPHLPPEAAPKEMTTESTPDAAPVPGQFPSDKTNRKLRPFVPVRIVIAPQNEENTDPAQLETAPSPDAVPDFPSPVYIPPDPAATEGKTD